MKHVFNLLFGAMVTAAAAVTFSACDTGDDATPAAPTITVSSVVTEAAPGGKIAIAIATTAPGTLKTVTVDGVEVKSYTTGTADAFNFDYTVPAAAALGAKTLTFEVTDVNSQKGSITYPIVVGKEVVVVEGAISASTTWASSKKYLLRGNVFVQKPAELTIQAGTIIKGDKVTKGALIINRGAKIHAVGTEANPIIFTSSAPATFRNYGDWGGVVLLGYATNNTAIKQKIEGISASTGDDGYYGAEPTAIENDDSGEFKYVRIEFAGIALSSDNELNGLTMGSVGSGTELDHIQVSYSGDDSYEWFGGTVNAKYLIAFRGWDDDFDTDFGYTGSVQYAVSHRDPNSADKSGSNGFESDNNGGGTHTDLITAPKFSNVSWFGPGVYAKLNTALTALNKGSYNQNYQYGAHIRRNSAIQIYNSIFVGSYLEGVHFDKSNPAAVFIGNYFARTGINSTPTAFTVMKATTGNVDGDTDLTGFANNNFNTDGVQSVILQDDVIVGLKNVNLTADQQLSLLGTAGTAMIAKTVPASLTQTQYIGAFDGTTNWTTQAWVNFSPNTTEY